MLVWRAVALVAIPWAIAATGWGIRPGQDRSCGRDSLRAGWRGETRVLHTAVARTWTFDEQAKADVAREWVWHMRNRPIGNYATEILRNTMRHRTAEQAIGKVETMLREMDDKLGHGPDGSEDRGLGLALSNDIQTGRKKPTRRPAIQLSASTGRNGPSTRTTG